MVGKWIAEAESWASTEQEKKLFAANAKRQISTWTDINSSLHDYAHKEWAGILSDLYYIRWKIFFDSIQSELERKDNPLPDFFTIETEWVNNNKKYPVTPTGDEIEIVSLLYKKYIPEITDKYQNTK